MANLPFEEEPIRLTRSIIKKSLETDVTFVSSLLSNFLQENVEKPLNWIELLLETVLDAKSLPMSSRANQMVPIAILLIKSASEEYLDFIGNYLKKMQNENRLETDACKQIYLNDLLRSRCEHKTLSNEDSNEICPNRI